MKKFVLTIVCAAVVLPLLVGCGSKKEEVVVTPTEETSTEISNETELAQADTEESSDSKENYKA